MIDLPSYDASSWQNRAQCAIELVDPNLMAPESASDSALEEAKQVCFRCPVRVECGDAAKAQDYAYGIWGGEWYGNPVKAAGVVPCQWCGCDIPNAETGRVRKFCGAAHRQAAYAARLAAVPA